MNAPTDIRDLAPEIDTNLIAAPGDPASLGRMYGALAKASAAFLPIVKNANVAYMSSKGPVDFDYADQSELNRKTVDALSENGLFFTALPTKGPTSAILRGMLLHESGARIEAVLDIPRGTAGDLKEFGSAITYLHRYLYANMLNLAGESDADERPTDEAGNTITRVAPAGVEVPPKLKDAKTIRELSSAMNALPKEDRARHMHFYNTRIDEMEAAEHEAKAKAKAAQPAQPAATAKGTAPLAGGKAAAQTRGDDL